MKQPTPLMLYTLSQIGESTCTGFGYNNNDGAKRYLNVNTLRALVKRGLVENAGFAPWNFGETTPVYRLSEAGKQTLKDHPAPIIAKDEAWKQVFAKGDYQPAPDEPKMYPNWESAQEAMDRGETVRIEMEPFQIDPALVQLAIDLQHKERFEQWQDWQRTGGEAQ